MISVRKGKVTTQVTNDTLPRYIRNGWEVVDKKKAEKPKTYDDYKKAQLMQIASNRSIHVTNRTTKKEIIEKLLEQDKRSAVEPTNKGFSDNLIEQ